MNEVRSGELVNVVSHDPDELDDVVESIDNLDITCWFCKNFKLDYSPLDYSGHRCMFTTEDGETGLLGKCLITGEETTTLNPACKQYVYAYVTDRFCSDIAIFNSSAVNDECRRADFNCDACHTKRFWEEVIEDKDCHFRDKELHYQMGLYGVYSFVPSGVEGGFDNSRFDVCLSDGTVLKDVGLWSRGFCPNDELVKQLRVAHTVVSR